MKNLSIICVGYSKEDGNFHYEYKHKVNWTNLEVSDNFYQTNIPHTTLSKDGTIKEKYYIKLSTKELIYNELSTVLIGIYYVKKDKIDLKEELRKLRELKQLKKSFEKHIDKQNLITNVYVKQTSKKMNELNTKGYVNKEFDKSIVSDTYEQVLQSINLQINQIECKKKTYSISSLKKECLKNISGLLKKDYDYQKKVFKDKEFVLKNKIKENKLDDNLKIELQRLYNSFKSKNLQNFTQKAIKLMYSNGLEVDYNHK